MLDTIPGPHRHQASRRPRSPAHSARRQSAESAINAAANTCPNAATAGSVASGAGTANQQRVEDLGIAIGNWQADPSPQNFAQLCSCARVVSAALLVAERELERRHVEGCGCAVEAGRAHAG